MNTMDEKREILLYLNGRTTLSFSDLRPLLIDLNLTRKQIIDSLSVLEHDRYIHSDNKWRNYKIIRAGVEPQISEVEFNFRLTPEGERYVKDYYLGTNSASMNINITGNGNVVGNHNTVTNHINPSAGEIEKLLIATIQANASGQLKDDLLNSFAMLKSKEAAPEQKESAGKKLTSWLGIVANSAKLIEFVDKYIL